MNLVRNIFPSSPRKELSFASADVVNIGKQILGGAIGGALFWIASKTWRSVKNMINHGRQQREYYNELFRIINQNEAHFRIGPDMARFLTEEDIPYYEGIIEKENIVYIEPSDIKDVPQPQLRSGE